MHFIDIGRKSPTFGDAAVVANEILNLDYDFDHCELYFNVFKYVSRPFHIFLDVIFIIK